MLTKQTAIEMCELERQRERICEFYGAGCSGCPLDDKHCETRTYARICRHYKEGQP